MSRRIKTRVFIKIYVALLLCILITSGTAAGRELVYTPLPIEQHDTVITANRPLVNYLSKALGQTITIRYEKDYEDILRLFKEGKIDIVHLGPLPYVSLRKNYPGAEPLAATNESDGKAVYTCSMVAAFDGPASVTQVHRSVALPQPLSTCGLLTAGYLLNRRGLKLETLHHDFLGNHDKVALAVAKGIYEVGTLKTSVAKKYTGLTLRVIEETPPFPGFLIVGNRATLSDEQIKRLGKALLTIDARDRSALLLGRYGFTQVSDRSYDQLRAYAAFFR